MPRKKKQDLPPSLETPQHSEPTAETKLKRKTKEAVDRTLNNIYAAGKKTHSLKSLERQTRSSHPWLWIVFISFAILAGLAWLVFFLFNPTNNFSNDEVTFKIDTPKRVIAGENAIFTLTYTNNLSTPLASANLFIKYPDGFEYAKADPAPIDKERREWSLGTIPPKTSGTITLTGTLWGNKDETIALRGFFNYRPANFNADFQKVAATDIKFDQSLLEIIFSGNESAHIGDTTAYTVTIKNLDDKLFANGLISLAFPQGFLMQSATPSPTQDQNTWAISALAPGDTQTIKFKGNFANAARVEDKIFALAQLVAHGDKKYAQQTLELATKLAAATNILELKVGSATERQSIAPAEKLSFNIAYKNTGNAILENASVKAVVEGPSDGGKSLFNWAAIDDKLDGAIIGEQVSSTARRGVIIWTKKEIPALASLKPGEGGAISFMLPVKEKTNFDVSKVGNAQSVAYAELLGGDTQNTALTKSNVVFLTLMTNLTLSATAQFKEKKQTTNDTAEAIYDITWILENSVHEVSDVHIAASLPEGVRWFNKTQVNAGALTFDADAKQVQWKINRIPASFPKTIISFEVAVEAQNKNSDAYALLGKTRLEAYNKTASASVMIEKDALIVILP